MRFGTCGTCGWWGREPSPGFDSAPGVKIQHPTFLEQIFNRGEQTLFYPNEPPSAVNSIKLILMRENAQRAKMRKKTSQVTNPKTLPEAAL